jgi:hypothetical protein
MVKYKINDWVDKYKKWMLIKSLIVNGFIFSLLIIFLLLYISPWFKEVSQNEATLLANVWEYEKIKKEWVDYETFKTLIPWNNKNLKNIVDKMWAEFFNSSLSNKTSWDYVSFLNTKKAYVNDLKKTDLISNRDEKVSTVLPFYTPWIEVSWSITSLWFTNYIETLLKSFSIKTVSEIWLWDVVPLAPTNNGKKPDVWSSEIYYTDLSLTLEWRKSDILDFLYFTQNVGNIDIENKNNTQDIVFNKDNYLNKVLIWQSFSRDYNLYQNKIMDVTSLTLSKYIDEGTNIRPENQKTVEGFLDFIKSTPESWELYQIDAKLRFYFRWLPSYKIEIFVQWVLDTYNNLVKNVKSSIAKSQNRDLIKLNPWIITVINSLKNIDDYLTTSQEKFKKLQTSLAKRENFETIYYDASDFKYDLDTISSVYEKNKQELDKTLNIKK